VTATTGPEQVSEEKASKTLLVVDIPPYIDRIKKTIDQIDMRPKQIFIETRIIEVNRDTLMDIGVDFSSSEIDTAASPLVGVGGENQAGATSLSGQVSPFSFNPLATGIAGTPAAGGAFATGLSLLFRKMNGFEFEAMIHALEEEVDANILSAPNIRTIDNQEASILIGTQYPILSGQAGTSDTNVSASAELDYYQDIGIQLKVTPQVNADGYVNMIVHPIISSISGFVSAGLSGSATATTAAVPIQYPILQTREAETQVIMKDGETIMIGGLLRDVKSKSRQGVPFLKDIPLLGLIFGRDTNDVEKIDLLIFITAYIIDEDEMQHREKLRFEEFSQVDEKLTADSEKKAEKRKRVKEIRKKAARRRAGVRKSREANEERKLYPFGAPPD